jgi:hypothetical protein
MHAVIVCASCNRQLRVPEDVLGKKVKCPLCNTTFFAAKSDAPAPPAAAEKKAAPTPPAEKPAPASAVENKADAPPEKKKLIPPSQMRQQQKQEQTQPAERPAPATAPAEEPGKRKWVPPSQQSGKAGENADGGGSVLDRLSAHQQGADEEILDVVPAGGAAPREAAPRDAGVADRLGRHQREGRGRRAYDSDDRPAVAVKSSRPWYLFLFTFTTLGIFLIALLAAYLGAGWPLGLGIGAALLLVCGGLSFLLAMAGSWSMVLRVLGVLGLNLLGYAAAFVFLFVGWIMGIQANTIPWSAWTTRSFQEQHYTASFPGAPQAAPVPAVPGERGPGQEHWVQLDKKDKMRFAVQSFEAEGNDRDQALLSRLEKDAVKDFPGGQVVRQSAVWASGHQGREVVIDVPRKSSAVRHIFVVGKRAWLLTVSRSKIPPPNFDNDVRIFMESLTITTPKAGPGPGGPWFPPTPSPLPPGRRAPPAATDFQGLLGYWPLDEGVGNRAKDASGKDNDGILHDAEWHDGVRGKSVLFNGRSSYMDYGKAPGFNFGLEAPFTIGGWFQTTERDGTLLSQRNGATGAPVLDLILEHGHLKAEVRQDGQEFAGVASMRSRQNVADGSWHHFALVRRGGGGIELFIDGDSQGQQMSGECGGPITTDLRAVGSERFWVQRGEHHERQYLHGWVDEVCLFGRSLTRS